MQEIDKLKRDLEDWERKAGTSPDNKAFDSLRTLYARAVGNVPESTIAAVFTTFLSYFKADGERQGTKALTWLAGVGSLLLMDFDGTAFTRDEWIEIREIVTLDAGDIDMEILSYILTQVLDHGAL